MAQLLRICAEAVALCCALLGLRACILVPRAQRRAGLRPGSGIALLGVAGLILGLGAAVAVYRGEPRPAVALLVIAAGLLGAAGLALATRDALSALATVVVARRAIDAEAARATGIAEGLARLSRVGGEAASPAEVHAALVDEVRRAPAVADARVAHEDEPATAMAVPLGDGLALAVDAEHPGLVDRERVEALAAAARSACDAVRARADASLARGADEASAAVLARLVTLPDVDGVSYALASELRARLPVDGVAVRLGSREERWYPAPATGEVHDAPPVPLRAGSTEIGTLRLQASRELSAAEQRLLARLVEVGGIALWAAGLRTAGESLREAQSGIVDAAEALASELEVERVLARLAETAPRVVRADAACVWLVDREREELTAVALTGLPAAVRGVRAPLAAGVAGAALAGAAPAVTPEVGKAAEAAEPPHPAFSALRRELAVPLRWRDSERAVLVLSAYAPLPAFTAVEIELCTALARLASLALETAEAFTERTRQARLDRASSLISGELAAVLMPKETAEAIERAAAAAFSPDEVHVRIGEAGGAPPLALERIALKERRVVAAGDARADSRGRGDELEGVGALISLPLARSGARRAPGVVTLRWKSPRVFDDEDLLLAERLRDAAAAAVERAGLEEAERRASSMSRELLRVSALLAGDLDERVVLRQIVAQAAELLGAHACALALVQGDEPIVRAVHGEAGGVVEGERLASGEALTREMLSSARPIAIADVAADGRVEEDDPLAQAGFAGFLGSPVQSADGGVRGVIAVYDRRARAWRQDEVDALAAFANSAAVTLRNALLYQRVADEKGRSDAVLGHVADAIVAVDADGRVIMWNAAAEEITQLRASRVRMRELAEVLRSELGDADGSVAALLRETAQHRQAREIRLVRGDVERWLSATGAPLRQPGETRPGVVFAMRDVSEERELDQLKSDFVATVSHELRTPLTSIYGFAETLLRQDVAFGVEERETFVRYIASESERLTRLVEGLLSVTRLEAGAVQIALVPVDIAACVRDVAGWAGGRSERHRIELVVPPDSLYADADPDRVRQVLINLIDNAIKYSPDGGAVTVRARARGAVVEVRVSDQGIGISERDQRNLFRKFFRVDAAMSRGIRGIGLGLYLVRGFVAAMGGRIWVESTEGRGSTFVFELPLSRSTPDERSERAA